MVKLALILLTEQHIPTQGQETSPTAAIIVGATILLAIVVVLYSRQKRKFNDYRKVMEVIHHFFIQASLPALNQIFQSYDINDYVECQCRLPFLKHSNHFYSI